MYGVLGNPTRAGEIPFRAVLFPRLYVQSGVPGLGVRSLENIRYGIHTPYWTEYSDYVVPEMGECPPSSPPLPFDTKPHAV